MPLCHSVLCCHSALVPAISSPIVFCLGAHSFRPAALRRNSENYPLRPAGMLLPRAFVVSHSLSQECSSDGLTLWFSALWTSNSAQLSPCKKGILTVFEQSPCPKHDHSFDSDHSGIDRWASSLVVVAPKLEATGKSVSSRMSELWCVHPLGETLV